MPKYTFAISATASITADNDDIAREKLERYFDSVIQAFARSEHDDVEYEVVDTDEEE